MRKQWLWYSIFLVPVLLIAQTQINWNTQVKNKPSLWNDPGVCTFLKRTGAFTFACAVAGTDYFNDPGSNGVLRRTALNTIAIAAPGTDIWNDPGSGTLLKRTGAYTFAAATNTDVNSVIGFTPENSANKGAVNGYAPLNGSSIVPTANLPSLWNDPGSGTFLKRTGSFTWAAAGMSDLAAAIPSSFNSKAHNSVGQTVANSSPVAISFDTNDYDNGGIHSTVTNPTRFTIQTGQDGLWQASGCINDTLNTGAMIIQFYKNGSIAPYGGSASFTGGSGTRGGCIHTVLRLVATDYLELFVTETTQSTTTPTQTWMAMTRLN